MVDQRRFAGIRPPHNRDPDRTLFRSSSADFGFRRGHRSVLGRRGPQRLIEIGQALVMFGADRYRFAETKGVGFKHPRRTGTSLAFIGDEHGGLARSAHNVSESAISS